MVAIPRDLQGRSAWSAKKIIRGICPLQQITTQLAGQLHTAESAILDDTAQVLTRLGH